MKKFDPVRIDPENVNLEQINPVDLFHNQIDLMITKNDQFERKPDDRIPNPDSFVKCINFAKIFTKFYYADSTMGLPTPRMHFDGLPLALTEQSGEIKCLGVYS